MPESTEVPSLDTRLRDALIPVLELEDEEMLDGVIVIYTVVYPDGSGLRYINSSGMPPWTSRGMTACYLEMLPDHYDLLQDDDDGD